MRINFSYPGFWVDVPEGNLVGIFGPRKVKNEDPPERVIEDGLRNPIGASPLEQLVGKEDRILIICDDSTRTTPVAEIFPFLEEELRRAKVKLENITILIGLGTHRPMSREELCLKLGERVVKNYRVVNHDFQNEAELVKIKVEDRFFKVNKLIKKADFIIGIGRIAPHRIAGYSGGSKIILPGICGKDGIDTTHWMAAGLETREILGKRQNPVRRLMDKVAKAVGLNYIINVIHDEKGGIYRLVAGDPVKAHEQGVQFCNRIFTTHPLKEEVDIVIIESYPADRDMWQAIKGIWTAEIPVKKGGIIILITTCPEGISREHPEVEKFGILPYEKIRKLIEEGKIKDITAGSMMAMGGRAMVEKAKKGFLVSRGIDREKARKIGFTPFSSPNEALKGALAETGKSAKVAVFKYGGELIPLLSFTA